jgi:hypothetical protein
MMAFPLQARLRGDAVEYLTLAMSSLSFHGLFEGTTRRSGGFPATLRALRFILEPIAAGFSTPWYELAPWVFLALHLTSMVVSWIAISGWLTRRSLPAPHPAALGLLLLHPGLVAFTSVLLSDTLAVDLLFGGAALWLVDRPSLPARIAAAFAAGLVWAWAVLCRPTMLIAVLVTVVILILSEILRLGSNDARLERLVAAGRSIALAGTLIAVLGSSALVCAEKNDGLCLANPAATAEISTLMASLGALSNVRTYWSRYSDARDAIALVNDGFLSEHYTQSCVIRGIVGADGEVSCVLARPQWLPFLAWKKLVALVDQQHYQPYAVDLTPPQGRVYVRAFALLTWLGLLFAIMGWGALIRRARSNSELRIPAAVIAAMFVLPLSTLATHVLFTVEPRYGLPLVPFVYLALGCAVTLGIGHWRLIRADKSNRRRVVLVAAILALWIGGFAWQIAAWDALDTVQQRVDAAFR